MLPILIELSLSIMNPDNHLILLDAMLWKSDWILRILSRAPRHRTELAAVLTKTQLLWDLLVHRPQIQRLHDWLLFLRLLKLLLDELEELCVLSCFTFGLSPREIRIWSLGLLLWLLVALSFQARLQWPQIQHALVWFIFNFTALYVVVCLLRCL